MSMTISQFCEKYGYNYSYMTKKIKALGIDLKKFRTHYVLTDEDVESLLRRCTKRIPGQLTVKESREKKELEEKKMKLNEIENERKELMEYINEKRKAIHDRDMILVGETVFEILEREYAEGDAEKIKCFLQSCVEFKKFMGVATI